MKQTELEQAAKELLDIMIRKGDHALDRLTQLVTPAFSGFGTGKDEVVTRLEDYLPLFEREVEQLTEADYELLRLTPKVLGNTGVVEGELNFLIGTNDQLLRIYARCTFVFNHEKGKWKAISGHMSTPMADQAEGEAFPLDAMKAKNQKLENLVAEKTADLKQKNRELQTEAALERVRARAMAMHKSEEVMDVASTLFEELQKLGFTFGASSIIIMNKDSGDAEYWIAGFSKKEFPESYHVKYFQHPYHVALLTAWKKGEKYLVYTLEGEEKKSYDEVLFTETGYKNIPEQEKDLMRGIDSVTFSIAFTKHGALHWGPSSLNEEQSNVLQRFANVFEQTYTRFLDLQKAESQAKEAQIELGLERLRSRAMAMQRSEELSDLIEMVYAELKRLDASLDRCIIMIFDAKTKGVTWWMASGDGSPIKDGFYIQYSEHPPQMVFLKAWEEKIERFQYILEGQEKKAWDEFLFSETELSKLPGIVIQNMKSFKKIYNSASFSNFGCLLTGSAEPLSNDSFNILLRFARVFDLTYTRFNDLKQAERAANEAQRQASIDRVRADIASMRKTSDLERITPLIWNELTTLLIPFIRCGVFIPDEKEKEVRIYLSTPEGKAFATFCLPFNSEGMIQDILHHWRKEQLFTTYWDEAAFAGWIKSLLEQGLLQENYTAGEIPADLYLHFFPFLQGMLYVGNTVPLTEDEIKLVQSLADAFSTAYARYEDFKKLEEAKRIVESTLEELKATQAQLIQKEKMASLGELTAGVAHEIQNPLNFINNFAEVNAELLEEMKQHLEGGNTGQAMTTAGEIEENEQKIAHHGRRADAIVKSMLQHSRVSTGKKEPTDINALVDEYLRLSYHGMRARDNAFSAIVETHYDASLGKAEIISQDIGRVLLNLFNNAFYAVNEKKKSGDEAFHPTVQVTTNKVSRRLEIKVKDNGGGIPENMLEKIYQPFFTTKPTGQGTGLGLSLSYDIVTQGHGGEMRVETKEGEGSAFIVMLPLNEKYV